VSGVLETNQASLECASTGNLVLLERKFMKSESDSVPMTYTYDQLCSASHDNVEVGDFSIMTDTDVVWLTEQALGEMPKQKFEVSRETFNKLILWYTKGIIPKEDKRR
jgi:hypothetical protein